LRRSHGRCGLLYMPARAYGSDAQAHRANHAGANVAGKIYEINRKLFSRRLVYECGWAWVKSPTC